MIHRYMHVPLHTRPATIQLPVPLPILDQPFKIEPHILHLWRTSRHGLYKLLKTSMPYLLECSNSLISAQDPATYMTTSLFPHLQTSPRNCVYAELKASIYPHIYLYNLTRPRIQTSVLAHTAREQEDSAGEAGGTTSVLGFMRS
jgi:hypothetical protein